MIKLVREAAQQVDVVLSRYHDGTVTQCQNGRICDAEHVYLSVAIRWLTTAEDCSGRALNFDTALYQVNDLCRTCESSGFK